MDTAKAIEYIRAISYLPGWRFDPQLQERQEQGINLRIAFVAPESNVAHAPEYTVPTFPAVDFYIPVGDCDTELDLYTKILHCILSIHTHEMREFFAVNGPAYDKPFHSHTIEGQYNWTHRRPVVEVDDLPMQQLIFAHVDWRAR